MRQSRKVTTRRKPGPKTTTRKPPDKRRRAYRRQAQETPQPSTSPSPPSSTQSCSGDVEPSLEVVTQDADVNMGCQSADASSVHCHHSQEAPESGMANDIALESEQSSSMHSHNSRHELREMAMHDDSSESHHTVNSHVSPDSSSLDYSDAVSFPELENHVTVDIRLADHYVGEEGDPGDPGHSGDSGESESDEEEAPVEEDDFYTADDFAHEFFISFICSSVISKNSARKVWAMVKRFVHQVHKDLPSYISCKMFMGSFEAKYNEFTSGTPQILTDYLLEDLLEEDPNERMKHIRAAEKFQTSRYPPYQYRLHHEKSYSNLQDVLQFMTQFHDDPRCQGRDLTLGWDHVPESKSNKHSLSVIALTLKCCPHKAVAISTSKSYVKGESHCTFEEQFAPIKAEIVAGGHKVIRIVSDKPCHDKLLNHKSAVGDYPCTKCDIKGTKLVVKPERIVNGKVVKAKTFNFFPWTPNVTEHTDARIRELMAQAQRLPDEEHDVKGYKGISCLNDLENFNLVDNVPLDYMHLMCLGVTKRMFGQSYRVNHSSVKTKKLKSDKLSMDNFNEKILRQRLPSEIPRRSRTMDFCNYKASEWRTITIATALHIIDDCKMKTHKCAWTMYFWLSRTYITCTDEELEQVNNYIDMTEFVKQFKLTYEKLYSQYFSAYNVHAIQHLASTRRTGTLMENGAYPFEGVFQIMIGSLVPGTRNTTKQAMLGTFCTYRGRRGQHVCQNAIKVRPRKEKCSYEDSLVYTNQGFWSVKKVYKDKSYKVYRLNVRPATLPCKHGVRGQLNMSLIGVYTYHSIDEVVKSRIHLKDVIGKLMKVGPYIVKIPKAILLECN